MDTKIELRWLQDERTGTQTLQVRTHEHQIVTDAVGAVVSGGLMSGEWTDVPTEVIRTTTLTEVFGAGGRTVAAPPAVVAETKLPEYWSDSFREQLKLTMCAAMAPLFSNTPEWENWPGSHTFAAAFIQMLNEPANFQLISAARAPQDKLDALEESLVLTINDAVAQYVDNWENWPGTDQIGKSAFLAAREYMTTAALGASLPERSELLSQMVPQTNPMRALAWQFFEEVVSPEILKYATGQDELQVRRIWDAVRRATLQSYPAPKNLRESRIRQALSKALNHGNTN